MVTVVGIDPGLAETGIGVVTGTGLTTRHYAFGCIETEKWRPLPERLTMIYGKIQELLEETTPDLMVVEDVFSLQEYPRSGILLGKVTGGILIAGCKAGVPVQEVAVREAKKILTGNGNASKKQLERSVRHALGHPDPIRPDHASDALALALIGLYRFQDAATVRRTRVQP